MLISPARRYELSDYLTVPLRLALAMSFLFPVADRLGLLGPPGTAGVSWGDFTHFLRYNAQVNSFTLGAIQPALGIAATILEGLLGLTLFLGFCTRLAAIGAGVLLLLFGSAMAVSFGIKSPFDYSVFSAMGGACSSLPGVYTRSASTLFSGRLRIKRGSYDSVDRGHSSPTDTSTMPPSCAWDDGASATPPMRFVQTVPLPPRNAIVEDMELPVPKRASFRKKINIRCYKFPGWARHTFGKPLALRLRNSFPAVISSPAP